MSVYLAWNAGLLIAGAVMGLDTLRDRLKRRRSR